MGWQWTAWIVLANVGISLLLALLINNSMPGRRYPVAASVPPRPNTALEDSLEESDIEWALSRMDSVIDVSTEDLAEIYARASEHAKARRNSGGA